MRGPRQVTIRRSPARSRAAPLPPDAAARAPPAIRSIPGPRHGTIVSEAPCASPARRSWWGMEPITTVAVPRPSMNQAVGHQRHVAIPGVERAEFAADRDAVETGEGDRDRLHDDPAGSPRHRRIAAANSALLERPARVAVARGAFGNRIMLSAPRGGGQFRRGAASSCCAVRSMKTTAATGPECRQPAKPAISLWRRNEPAISDARIECRDSWCGCRRIGRARRPSRHATPGECREAAGRCGDRRAAAARPAATPRPPQRLQRHEQQRPQHISHRAPARQDGGADVRIRLASARLLALALQRTRQLQAMIDQPIASFSAIWRCKASISSFLNSITLPDSTSMR